MQDVKDLVRTVVFLILCFHFEASSWTVCCASVPVVDAGANQGGGLHSR